MSSSRNNILDHPVQQYLHFDYKARYFIEGPSIESADLVFLCLHGYGQLSPYFIKKLKPLTDRSMVIVPEGLHRFYLNGNQGRVGASWMTKENRLDDIQNYLNYIDAIIDQVLGKSDIPIVVLGFSQGSATAGRWVAHTQRVVSDLILWSGMFPHDIDTAMDIPSWKKVSIYSVIGDKDPYISDDRLVSENKRCAFNGLELEEIRFNGGHEILADTLLEVRDRIQRKN